MKVTKEVYDKAKTLMELLPKRGRVKIIKEALGLSSATQSRIKNTKDHEDYKQRIKVASTYEPVKVSKLNWPEVPMDIPPPEITPQEVSKLTDSLMALANQIEQLGEEVFKLANRVEDLTKHKAEKRGIFSKK